MKTFYFTLLVSLFCISAVQAQDYEHTWYVQKADRGISRVLLIINKIHHGETAVEMVNHAEVLGKDQAFDYVSYLYLGIDSQNTLHLEKRDTSLEGKTKSYPLVFKLNDSQTGVLSLSGCNITPPVRIEVKATNEGLEVKYLGNLEKLAK